MSDRELLELAAKAAGIRGFWVDDGLNSGSNAEPEVWNPLLSDSDALRLAVKLKFGVDVLSAKVTVFFKGGHRFSEVHGDDSYAATRLAIVRAAAEIGKEMP